MLYVYVCVLMHVCVCVGGRYPGKTEEATAHARTRLIGSCELCTVGVLGTESGSSERVASVLNC